MSTSAGFDIASCYHYFLILLSIGRSSLPSQKHHQLDSSFSFLSDVHQTLTREALSPDSIKIPVLSALFGVVRSSPSNKQLELSLSVLRDIRQTLTDEALSKYSITLFVLSALFGDVQTKFVV